MRTTLTLDDDVAARLAALQKRNEQSFKALVNDALRQGLDRLEQPPRKRKPFRTRGANVGRILLPDVDNVAEVLALIEGETYR
jgi:hypothetical protein